MNEEMHCLSPVAVHPLNANPQRLTLSLQLRSIRWPTVNQKFARTGTCQYIPLQRVVGMGVGVGVRGGGCGDHMHTKNSTLPQSC